MADIQPVELALVSSAVSLLAAAGAWIVWRLKFSEKTQERKTDQIFAMAEQYVKNCRDTQERYEALLQEHGQWAKERAEWVEDRNTKNRQIEELRQEIDNLRKIIDSMTKEKYGSHAVSSPK